MLCSNENENESEEEEEEKEPKEQLYKNNSESHVSAPGLQAKGNTFARTQIETC